MNFKSTGLKAAIAATVVAGSSFAVAPAQAATVGRVSFGGLGQLTSVKKSGNSGDAMIVFKKDAVLKISDTPGDLTGAFTGFAGGTATFFNNSFSTSLKNQASFITFKSADLLKTITFDLTKFIIDPGTGGFGEIGSTSDTRGQFVSRLSGVFNPGATATDATINAFATFKQLNGTGNGGNVTSIVLSTPVPTPALLPGLFGLGVAALRKRKSEESEVEAAETAKA